MEYKNYWEMSLCSFRLKKNWIETEQENTENKIHAARAQGTWKQSSPNAKSEMKVGGTGTEIRDTLELFISSEL